LEQPIQKATKECAGWSNPIMIAKANVKTKWWINEPPSCFYIFKEHEERKGA
jgi:hypothetical protein